MLIWQIFIVFFRIGFFAVGGAYSFLPLIQRETVDRYHWLTPQEFLDILGVVKIFPGAISIKFATYTGYKLAGIPGAVVANLANFLSPAVIILLVTIFYQQGKEIPLVKNAFAKIQLAVLAMIIAVAFQSVTVEQMTKPLNAALVLLFFGLFFWTKIHPAFLILGAGLLGMVLP